VLLFTAIIWLAKKGFSWANAIKENMWVVILIAYMFISMSWSGMPFVSLKRWIRELQAIIMALVLLAETSPRQAMECILRRTSYILIPFSVVLCKYFPEYGVVYNQWGDGMWIGVTLHKNTLGRLCLIGVFYLIWSLVRRRQGRNPVIVRYQSYMEILVLLLALYLMIGYGGGGSSATALTALMIGLMIYGGFSLLKKRGIVLGPAIPLIIVAAIIALGVISVFTNASLVGGLAPIVGRNSTLTDRTSIWETLLPVVRQNPLFGKGIGGFWTPQHREILQFSEAHNGYLDSIIEFGFVGLILISAFLLVSVQKSQRMLVHDFDWGVLCTCYIIMAAFYNITESSINELNSHLTAVILFQSILSSFFLGIARDRTVHNLSGTEAQ
jgi:O-antigen ligase